MANQDISNQDRLKRFLRNYYLAAFFRRFVFAYMFYNLLFSVYGLSVFQISVLLAWFSGVALVFEVPSGALADRWSRRKMLVIAALLEGLCFVILFFARGNFYLYALGFLFWAIGSSFLSGTAEALLFDGLTHFEAIEQYETVVGRRNFYSYVALAISLTSGGFIAAYSLDLSILLSAIPMLLAAFSAALIGEVPKAGSPEAVHYLDHLKLGFREVRTNRVLLYLFVYLLAFTVLENLTEFDQLYYHLVQLPIFTFGLIGTVGALLSALGARQAHRLKDRFGVFFLLPSISTCGLVFVGVYPSIPMIGLLQLSYVVMSPVSVLMESRIQRSIRGISRATVTSISAFLGRLFGLLFALLFGLVSNLWSLPSIYLSAAILLIALVSCGLGGLVRQQPKRFEAYQDSLNNL